MLHYRYNSDEENVFDIQLNRFLLFWNTSFSELWQKYDNNAKYTLCGVIWLMKLIEKKETMQKMDKLQDL